MTPPLPDSDPPISPRWSTPTKFLVSLVFLVLSGALVVRFQVLIGPLAMAFILAYLLNPAAAWLMGRTGWKWGAAVNLVFLVLLVVTLSLLTAAGIALAQQAVSLYHVLEDVLPRLPERLQSVLSKPFALGPFIVDLNQPFSLGPFTLDLSALNLGALYDRLLTAVQPLLSRTGTLVGSLASGTAEFVGWLLFVLVVSYYLLHSLKDLLPSLEQVAPQGYAYDVRRLAAELGPIWNAFLRGQVTLALIMGLIVGTVMAILGVRYAVILGLLAGLLEFIPIVGPFIAGTVAVIVAIFQPDNWLGLEPVYFALLVAGVQILLQQVENNVLVPRIIGGSLNLHPIAILVGAVVAASLAGIVGLLLSAPTIATLRVFGVYAYRKLFDLDPWPEPPPRLEAPPARVWPARLARLRRWLRQRLPRGPAAPPA